MSALAVDTMDFNDINLFDVDIDDNTTLQYDNVEENNDAIEVCETIFGRLSEMPCRYQSDDIINDGLRRNYLSRSKGSERERFGGFTRRF